MRRIGQQLIKDSKAALVSEKGSPRTDKIASRGRDLLSLLIKANMATEVPQNRRMSDEEVLARKCFLHCLAFDC
jgi:hypothetical protein